MIDEDTYCIDIPTQISAITSALDAVAVGLVDDHLKHWGLLHGEVTVVWHPE